MKRYKLIPWVIISAIALCAVAQADDPKARDIMQKVHDRDDGDNRTA